MPTPIRTQPFNFENSTRAPLLMIAGEHNHTVPAHVAKSSFAHYNRRESYGGVALAEAAKHYLHASEPGPKFLASIRAYQLLAWSS